MEGQSEMTDLAQLRNLAEAATQGPWHVQYGDDERHMCMTAISTSNERKRNEGQFSQEECERFVAVTLHQCYPFVNADCERDDDNSAFIAAANPAAIIELLDLIEAQRGLLERALGYWVPRQTTLGEQITEHLRRQEGEKE